jgi:hypothetical protein
MYVYIQSEPGLYTVGFFGNGGWYPESDYNDREKAAQRVHYLNGGNEAIQAEKPIPPLKKARKVKTG